MSRAIIMRQPALIASLRGPRHSSGGTGLSHDVVLSAFADGVQTLTLSSPRTRNALSLDLMRTLRSRLAGLADNPRRRAVVLRARGDVFSAGHNLKEMTAEEGYDYHRRIFDECRLLMLDIVRCPAPVIAAVDGLAAAAGCQLVAACDLAVATQRSSFSTPGANFGLFCSTPGVPLARCVPRKVAADMLFTGTAINADQALRAGLVSRVVKDLEDLDKDVEVICNEIRAKPKAVIELGKTFFHAQLEMGLDQALDEGGKVMVNNLGYRDAQEGISAFKMKRKPDWTHSDDKV